MRKPANTVFLWGSPENYPNYRAALESVGRSEERFSCVRWRAAA